MTEPVDEFAEFLQDPEELRKSAALLLAVVALAYAIENGEPLNVDSQIVDDIIESGQKTGRSEPHLGWKVDEDGRLKISVEMHKPGEEAKQYT